MQQGWTNYSFMAVSIVILSKTIPLLYRSNIAYINFSVLLVCIPIEKA